MLSLYVAPRSAEQVDFIRQQTAVSVEQSSGEEVRAAVAVEPTVIENAPTKTPTHAFVKC